jgi:hypothetical protein
MATWLMRVAFLMRVFITIIFFTVSLCKLLPSFHPDTYYHLDADFRNKFTPMWQERLFSRFEITVSSMLLKNTLGGLELFCSVMIWNRLFRFICCLILTTIMIGAALSHYWLQENFLFPVFILCCVIFISIADNVENSYKESRKSK